MAINTSLLVSAPILQDYFVDKDTGLPLSGGMIYLYQDNARTTFKNWYQQVGTPGNYSFIPLPNPCPLTSVGTISDGNGNDVIPFYYPYDENNPNNAQAYFIQVFSTNSQGNIAALQFSRQGFPFTATVSPPAFPAVPTLQNLITNNVFWRNIGSVTINNTPGTNTTPVVVCPSQHDGYTSGVVATTQGSITWSPDITYNKTITSTGSDTISFTQFTANDVLSNSIIGTTTPEYYMTISSNGAGSGEAIKYLMFPVSLHLKTLSLIPYTFNFWAINNNASPNASITLSWLQFTGTGALTPPLITPITTVTPGSAWTPLTSGFQVTPDSQAAPFDQASLGVGGDDALYLLMQFPLNVPFNMSIAKPSMYLSSVTPTNDFTNYDQVNTIISSPRTGDVRTSLNAFAPWGWVPSNDGFIGYTGCTFPATPGKVLTRANADTWPLYNLIWNSVLDHWAPVSTGRGSNAYADFIGLKGLTLTRNLGRVLAGDNSATLAIQAFTTNYGASHNNLTLTGVSNSLQFPTGTPIQLTLGVGGVLPTGLVINTVYYVINPNIASNVIQLATTLDNAYANMPIDIQTNATPIVNIQTALGAFIGESAHTQTLAELVSHHHSTYYTVTPGPIQSGSGYQSQLVATTGDTGGGQPFPVIQPTTYMNVFLKL